jgi:heptose II phosphotransferase
VSPRDTQKNKEFSDDGVKDAGGAGRFSGAVIASTHAPYRVHIKDDGHDYLALWNDFRQGRFAGASTLKQDRKREVRLVEAMGRQFIIKVDRQVPKRFKSRWRQILGGPMHSGIMRRVNRAVRQGCTVTPDIYLVAERMEKRVCREACIIQEYLPDPPLWEFSRNAADSYGFDLTPQQKDEVGKAMRALHEHRLALADLNPYNILVSGQGYKIIDLSWAGSFRIGQALDVLNLRHKMKIRLPVRGFALRLALCYLSLKYKIEDLFRSPEKAKLRWRTEPLAVSTARLRAAAGSSPAPEQAKDPECGAAGERKDP